MSIEEVEVMRDMFTLMDTNNDGKVTYQELRAGLRKVGSQLAEPEMKMLMDVVNSRYSFVIGLISHFFKRKSTYQYDWRIFLSLLSSQESCLHLCRNLFCPLCI